MILILLYHTFLDHVCCSVTPRVSVYQFSSNALSNQVPLINKFSSHALWNPELLLYYFFSGCFFKSRAFIHTFTSKCSFIPRSSVHTCSSKYSFNQRVLIHIFLNFRCPMLHILFCFCFLLSIHYRKCLGQTCLIPLLTITISCQTFSMYFQQWTKYSLLVTSLACLFLTSSR